MFQAKHIHGMGRGKVVGFPTVNLTVPDDIHIDDGVYAAWIMIDGKPYRGALHYGPIPTFDQNKKTLEVHLIDITNETMPDTNGKMIEVDIVERLRDIKKFLEVEDLTEAIARDVERVRSILK